MISLKKMFFGTLLNKILSSILGLVVAYLLLCALVLNILPTKIFDNKVSWAPVPQFGYQMEFIKNSASQKISLWSLSNPKSENVILYLHGSTGRVNDMFFEMIKSGNIISPAYPGYHESEGSPNTENVYETAELAYQWIVAKGIPEEKITILGHSMGGSPAVNLASKHPKAKKLILINTFSSAQSLCSQQLSILCSMTANILNTTQYAPNVAIPIRQFGYVSDLTVPFVEGQKLYEKFTGSQDKKFIELTEFTHTYPDWSKISPEL